MGSVQLAVNDCAHRQKRQESKRIFLIDVVSLEPLESYIGTMDADVDAMTHALDDESQIEKYKTTFRRGVKMLSKHALFHHPNVFFKNGIVSLRFSCMANCSNVSSLLISSLIPLPECVIKYLTGSSANSIPRRAARNWMTMAF